MTVALDERLPKTLGPQHQVHALEFEILTRAADVEGAPEEEVIKVTISTDAPCNRGYAMEILSHEPSAVDMSYARHGLALLLEHGGPGHKYGDRDPNLHVGVVENVRLEGRKLVGEARFSDSPLAQQVKRDVVSKVRKFLSVGWPPTGKVKVTKAAKSYDELSEVTWV